MVNLILFGPPGSGKGTQAMKIAERYNLAHISTGDLFRFEIGNQTELGNLARSYMDNGVLVPDDVTIRMLISKMDRHPDNFGFIFDGFPRTLVQSQALDNLLSDKFTQINALLLLKVDDNEIVKRILSRGKLSGRSDDNNEEIIRKRIDVYNKETQPVYEYYAEQGKSHKIEGQGDVDFIFDEICQRIDTAMAKVM